MSTSSNLSDVSISWGDSDVDLETLLIKTYRDIQSHLNNSEYNLRYMGTCCDRADDDFAEMMRHGDLISDDIDEMIILFTDLKRIVKELVGKPITPDEKLWLKNYTEKKKLDALNKKTEDRQLKEQQKQNKLGNIAE
jgi:hypothetical protein